jgi:hypothetical protein
VTSLVLTIEINKKSPDNYRRGRECKTPIKLAFKVRLVCVVHVTEMLNALFTTSAGKLARRNHD